MKKIILSGLIVAAIPLTGFTSYSRNASPDQCVNDPSTHDGFADGCFLSFIIIL
ncbi:MAG TPA: hypothetical protein VKR53_21650 [Puia sp.]|nr:hypothetical protein [Puia sp.]